MLLNDLFENKVYDRVNKVIKKQGGQDLDQSRKWLQDKQKEMKKDREQFKKDFPDDVKEEEELDTPNISTGDEIKVGKWKNSKATVKGFKKDKHGQPVLKTNKGDKKLFNPRVSKLEPKKVEEKAPPGDKAERFIKKNKAEFKDRYGDRWEEVLYATAWKQFG